MAKRREMIGGKPPQPFIDEASCLAGMVHSHYTVTVGPVTLWLTKEERARTLETWSMLENNIDPETREKFTPEKLAFYESIGARH